MSKYKGKQMKISQEISSIHNRNSPKFFHGLLNHPVLCLVPIRVRISPDVVKFGSTAVPKMAHLTEIGFMKDQFHLELI